MSASPSLSVIIPTYNESKNISILLERLKTALAGLSYELIVVDDNSPDRTWEVVERIALEDERVQVIRRFDERGLSSAVLTGMSAARGKALAVMDADLQHDEGILPDLARAILQENYDAAIGSRAAEGGDYGEWSKARLLMSRAAALAARIMLPIRISDPMSGYFVISREVYHDTADEINPRGFKILLEFVGRARGLKIKEIGYSFRNRLYGETKLSPSVVRNFFVALYDLRFGKIMPPSFILYGLVGLSGVLVNLLGFRLGEAIGLPHVVTGLSPHLDPIYLAAPFGYQLAIISNYVLNNWITFWEKRHRGWGNLKAFLMFEYISLFGLLVHTAVFQLLHINGFPGGFFSEEWRQTLNIGLATIVAMVSNYYLNISFTWGRR